MTLNLKNAVRRRPAAWLLLLLVLVNLALYTPALNFDFLKDDHVLVENNPRIKSTRVFLDTLGKRFFAFPDFPFLHYWRPLTLLSYLADYSVWREDPFGFHLTNLVLNAAAACLVFLFFLAWGGRTIPAFAIAAWFSLHPLHAENVAWISGRPDLLAAIFTLLAALAFLCYLDKGQKIFLIGVFAFFIPGLLVKENLVVFPLVALVMVWMRGHWRRARWPLAGLSLVSVAFALLHASISGSGGILARFSISQVPLAFRALGVYTRMILVPLFPDPYFTMGQFDSHVLIWILWALLVCLVLIAVFYRKDGWTYMRGAVGFLALMLPVLNPVLVPSYPQVAMRFIYLPAIAGGALLVDLGIRLWRKRPRVLLLPAVFVMGIGLIMVNRVYQEYFRNDEVFYSRMIALHPDDSLLLLPMALKRAGEKRYPEAMALARLGVAVSKDSRWVDVREMSLLLQANLMVVTGDPEEGFRLAKRISRESAQPGMRFKALMIMAKYRQRRGEFSESLALLDQALKLGRTAPLHLQRCLLLARMGRWEAATGEMESARRLNPELTDFHRLDRLLRSRGRPEVGVGSAQPSVVPRGE